MIDPHGTVQHLSGMAEALLRMAAGSFLPSSARETKYYGVAGTWLRPLAMRLQAAVRATEDEPPPARIGNDWRQFTFRAYRLASAIAGMSPLIAVSVTRHLPLHLKLLTLPAVQVLPWREKEVCLLLAQGENTARIGAKLRLGPHTVVAYFRSQYRRFEVSNRNELVRLLLIERAASR